MSDAPRVYYDGSCPLCRAEIGMYRSKAEQVAFVDVSESGAALPDGLDQQAALARFHVETGTGEIKSGAAGFVALWSHVPGWRWLARTARIPGVLWVMERLYRLFLIFRPQIVRLFTALTRKRA